MNGNTKLRVAVGIFHDIAKLSDAVDGLAATDCLDGDIVLLCDSAAIGDRLAGVVSAVSGGRLRIVVRGGDNGTGVAQRVSGDGNPHSSLSRDQILHFETWIDAHLADNLDHQLKRGGCLLLCPVLSSASEQSVSGILLQHSAAPVQLHDIRPAG